MTVGRARGATLVALVIGAAPGFLLPVVITWRLELGSAAALLLAISLTQIVYAALGSPYETTMLVRLGSLYGASDTRQSLPGPSLAIHAATRVGPVLLCGVVVLVAAATLLPSDIDAAQVIVLTVPLALGLVVQVTTAGLSAHLYAIRRLPEVYFATFFLGGPSLLVLAVWPQPLAVAGTYSIGQLLRAGYLWWRVRASLSQVRGSTAEIVVPPTWRELVPQVLASVAGQAMPMVVQGLFVASGAAAIAAGAVALRIFGAAWQAVTSTVAMPEVVTLTRELLHISAERRRPWLDRRAGYLLAAVASLTVLGAGLIGLTAAFAGDLLPTEVVAGLWWSLIAMIGFPGGMLNFWAGRGLLVVGAARWVPIVIVVAFIVGAPIALVAMHLFGGVGALIGHAVGFLTQGAVAFLLLRRLASAPLASVDESGGRAPDAA